MIVLKNVCKTLSGREVLKDISFHIAENETVGIIGLNGAGKTTLLDTIVGMIEPDSGFVRTGGTESVIEEKRFLRNLVYVSGTRSQMWETLKVKDSFDNCIKMYRINREAAGIRLAQLAEIFEIKAFMDRTPGSLSVGERMRCELVYALLTQPKILLLDEVMIGLDISIKYRIMQFFEKYRNEKRATIIYTSHNLTEVETLCERVILIDAGRIIFDGRVERIMEMLSPLYRMEVRVVDKLPDLEDLPLEKYSVDGDVMTLDYDKQKIETAQILRHLMEKCKISDVRLFEPDLEGTIKKIYGYKNEVPQKNMRKEAGRNSEKTAR